jgi:TBC1 domain family member 15
VTAGSTNSGARPASVASAGSNVGGGGGGSARPGSSGDKGKRVSGELEDVRPKVISPELRGLLSRKVEVLPRKLVRKTGEGISSLEVGKDGGNGKK